MFMFFRSSLAVFWIANFLSEALPGANPINPISQAFGWSEYLATLTDRALWLFFLALILIIGWILDKRKETELIRLREAEKSTLSQLAISNERLEVNNMVLDEVKEEMSRSRDELKRVRDELSQLKGRRANQP